MMTYFQLDYQGKTLTTFEQTWAYSANKMIRKYCSQNVCQTWRHLGVFPPGSSCYIFEQETCKLLRLASSHGPRTKYVKLRVAQAPGMPGAFFPLPRFSDPDMCHGTCVTHVSWRMPVSLTSGFIWCRWKTFPAIFSMICEKAVDQTLNFYMIWDIAKLMIHERGFCGHFFNLTVIQISPDISL